jgi:hypothetical protein
MLTQHISEFKEKIEIVIDTGDINTMKSIINSYKDIIDKKYIEMAQDMLQNLLEEKLEDMSI